MRFKTFLPVCLLALAFCCPAALAKEAAGITAGDAVLIVAFGTSVEKARISYQNVEEQVKAAFPGSDIRWAWTAHSLLHTAPGGTPMLSPQEALAKLATDGVKDLSVLSLHIIPGAEYSALEKIVAAFEGLPKGLETIRLSPPLLNDTESSRAVAEVLLKTLPKERKAEDAVLFVGHGTHHPAGVFYPALAYYLGSLDPKAFVGTVEGDLDLERLLPALKAGNVKKIWLTPLMTVAGDHAMNDLFGNDPDSWKAQLTAAGFTVAAVNRGLGENPALVARWVQGLCKAAPPAKHE